MAASPVTIVRPDAFAPSRSRHVIGLPSGVLQAMSMHRPAAQDGLRSPVSSGVEALSGFGMSHEGVLPMMLKASVARGENLPRGFVIQPRLALQVPAHAGRRIVPSFSGNVVQAANGDRGRLITGPVGAYKKGDPSRLGWYVAGWITDVADYWSSGLFYDAIQLVYAVVGEHGGGTLARIEEVIRFVQHHPEVLERAAYYLPILATFFGVPTWAVQMLLLSSRGAASDSIGALLTSLVVPSWLQPYVPVRHLGRSALDRGIALAHAVAGIIPGAQSVLSGISRVFHGYSLNSGTAAAGPARPGVNNLGSVHDWARMLLPMERLHIVAAQHGAQKTPSVANSAYGAAGSNTLMIPNETANTGWKPSMAIESPTGQLEAMTMGPLFRARGIRPRAGELEHYGFASLLGIA